MARRGWVGWGVQTLSDEPARLRVFWGWLREYLERGHGVRVAVESMGSKRCFLRRMERLGAEVKLINTMKFTVVTESVKKTDRHDC